MSATIREARADDAPRLVELLCGQMREHALPASAAAIAPAVARVFAAPALGRFLVAEASGEVIGLAYIAFLHSMEHAATVPLLEELYVAPEHRGCGAGSALLRRAAELHSIAPGVPMELEVDATHREVETFYRRHGFTRRDRTRWIHQPRGAVE